MRAWPLTPTRDSGSGSLEGEARTASSNSPTGSAPCEPGAPSPLVDGAGTPPQPDPMTPKRLDLQQRLKDVKTLQDANRALHAAAGQRIDGLTERVNRHVNQLRADLDALLAREVETREQVAEKL